MRTFSTVKQLSMNSLLDKAETFTKNNLRFFMIIVMVSALGLRLYFAFQATFPGHSDSSFYYAVAESLVKGDGLQINYIWHYLYKPRIITHAANDYWMPLTSIIMSISMRFLGINILAALLPSILAGIALSVTTYFLSKYYFDSEFVAYGSACLVLFIPNLFTYSLLTESTIFYSFFINICMYSMLKGRENPRFFPTSAIFAAFAYLTRQDGVLLVPILLSFICFSKNERKINYLLLTILIYVLCLLPFFAYCYKSIGTLLTNGASFIIS